MLNLENASAVAGTIGTFMGMDSEVDMQRRGYLRLKVQMKVDMPLKSGLWWTDESGTERWAQIRYERLLGFCYGCGTLGHTAQTCNFDIILFEVKPTQPMYGPWITCTRQRKVNQETREENHGRI